LCLFYPPAFGLGSLDLSLWEDIGLQLGRRIATDRAQAQAQQEQELLHTLYAVSNHLASSLDPDWVLSNALELSISATNARDGSIFLLPAPGSTAPRILRRALSGAEADQVIDDVLAGGLAGWVVRHKEGTIIANTSHDPRWLSFENDPSPPGSALAVPLKARGRVLGVITLDHAEADHFDSRHMALMRAIAHQISTAIERARLYDEVSHLAQELAQRVEERTQELRATQAQLIQAEKLAALGELAAGIAHEINNPLHILQAYLEYMVDSAEPGDAVLEFVEPMDDALENVARLARQLRDFSRPASGQWQPFDVNQALGNVLRLVNKELSNWGITVRESLADYLPHVRGDGRQLEQVFLNLILNARDAMPAGGVLAIETRADTDTVYATVRDTGIGIREEDLARIFEPYFTTKEDRGTGLGLAICQRVAVQHGGKITVRSELGEGAAFTVHLPVDVYERDADAKGPGSA
jgi:signal transduction histidine kinase